jgi:cytochrome c oxidase cbb3-type subunit IV
MTYETASRFAQDWGLLYFSALFVCVLVYAFWPRNKAAFDRAARLPLENHEDEE